jgi:hypothetical protein
MIAQDFPSCLTETEWVTWGAEMVFWGFMSGVVFMGFVWSKFRRRG